MAAELYSLIGKVNDLQQQLEQLRGVVVYKNEMANALKELETKFEEMFENAIQRLGNLAKEEVANIFDPFHNSLKAEFKICLDAALRRLDR
jgi:hypothetical protein